MTFTPEDLGFSRAYTIDMATPGFGSGSSSPSTGTSTPAADVFGSSTDSTASSSSSSPASPDPAAVESFAALAPVQRRATDLAGGDQGTSSKSAGNPLPPHSRHYPKPAADIDLAEALARQPRAWSIRGQMEANRRREEAIEARQRSQLGGDADDLQAARRRADPARVKAELLAMKDDMRPATPPGGGAQR